MNSLMQEAQSSDLVTHYLLPWGINIALALTIFIAGRWLAKLITQASKGLLAKTKTELTLSRLLGNILYTVLLAVVVVAALDQLGVNTNAVLLVFVTVGLAAGLALKDSLSNFAAGVMLILFKPFKTGDLIEAAGTSGMVEEIRLLDTQMRSDDNREITVPNSHIYGGTIVNFTAKNTRRIDLVVSISYDDDIRKAKKLLEGILAQNERILRDPPPLIAVLELDESSVNLAVRPWVKTPDYWPARFDLNESIKDVFDANGINIPRPQLDVHHRGHKKSYAA